MAYAIETLLKHNEIKEVPLWLTWVISFLVVLIAVVFLERYDRFVAKRSTLTKVVFGSILVKGLVRFAWIAIFMWLAFLLFSLFNISLNLAYAVTAIAFTVSANNLYDQLSKYFKEKKETKSLSI